VSRPKPTVNTTSAPDSVREHVSKCGCDDCTKVKRRQWAEAHLRADHEPRALLIGGRKPRPGASIEPQRVSRVDETAITQQIRDAEAGRLNSTRADLAVRLARIESELQDLRPLLRDRHLATRQDFRDVTSAATLIGKVRKGLATT
jgi:hypothetical protein